MLELMENFPEKFLQEFLDEFPEEFLEKFLIDILVKLYKISGWDYRGIQIRIPGGISENIRREIPVRSSW